MAKMRVRELSNELSINNKDIITFLEEKGIDGKSPASGLEEAEVKLVRDRFAKAAAVSGAEPANHAVKPAGETVEEVPKAEPSKTKTAKAETPKAETQKTEAPRSELTKPEVPKAETPKTENPRAERTPGGEAGKNRQEAPAKKKKTIIFVSNPQNSKAQGQGQGYRQGQRDDRRNQKPQNDIYRPLIKPHVPPSQTPSVNYVKPGQQQRTNKPVQNQPEAAPQVQAQQHPQNRPDQSERRTPERNGGDFRHQGDNRNNRNNQDNRDNRDSRNNRNTPSQGFDRNNAGRGAGNARPDRNGKPQDRFRSQGQGGFAAPAPSKEGSDKKGRSADRDKHNRKDSFFEDGAKGKNTGKAGRFIKPEKKVEAASEEVIKVITIPESITIKELAEKMKLQPSAIVKKLFLQGQIVTVNQEVPFEKAEEIAIEYDIICEKEVKVDVIEELLREEEENEADMTQRPPVICVMGHVDHGKTSLLDAIRKTNVTDREAGGITQHIGAYTVSINNQRITFLDTPGHEAFTAMRMRGANSTDIAILVVAADDGVMPQTVEAINHAKAAGIEIIVAVNKIDKPNANIDRVKQELTEYELIPVDWGGSTEFVPVSAKSGEGIDSLLETILLTAEILELKANVRRRARGLVIEAELDKGRGPVATVLVQKGTLHVGDFISAGSSHGKVRAMIDDKGRRVKEALPSTPVEILGLSDVPSAGETFIVHENDKTAKSYADTYKAQHKEKMLEDTKSRMSLDDLFSQIQAGSLKELNIIVKADVQGSVEAVKESLTKLSNEEVIVKCIHGGVGAINESDVTLAAAANAIIIGFNVRPDATAKTIAEREKVDVRLYRVIYQAIEDVQAAMKGMLDPVFEEKIIGHAEVRQIFRASAVGNIAGSYVLDGVFQRGCKVRITREGDQIFEGSLASLKRFKDDAKEVKAGYECGLVFEGFDQMQELDIVEAYIMVEVPR